MTQEDDPDTDAADAADEAVEGAGEGRGPGRAILALAAGMMLAGLGAAWSGTLGAAAGLAVSLAGGAITAVGAWALLRRGRDG